MRQKMSLIIENEIEVLELFLIKILNLKSKVPVLTQTVFQPFFRSFKPRINLYQINQTDNFSIFFRSLYL